MSIEINKILVAFDMSETSQLALSKGLEWSHKTGSELHIVYVDSPKNLFDFNSVESHINELRKDSLGAILVHHKTGPNPYKEIHLCEKEIGADLIMIGTQGKTDRESSWIGGNAFKVASMADCPVLTFPIAAKELNFKKILLPLDSTSETRQKTHFTAKLAHIMGAKMYILGVSREKNQDTINHLKVYGAQAQDALFKYSLDNEFEMQVGVKIAPTILEVAEKQGVSMISIMTEAEPTGLFMGPAPQQILNQSRIPVLVTRTKEVGGVGGGGY